MTGPLELRDPLTGVYSRAFLQVRLREETERSRRYGLSFSLLILDLDHFKSVNDAFGHMRGDEALIECAARLLRLIRETDLVFRYGGDEFVLLLPHTSKDQALILAQRLVNGVAAVPFAGDPPLHISASIGLAQYPDDANTPESLFERADFLHYEAKRAGRGRVASEAGLQSKRLVFDVLARPVERDQALKTVVDFLDDLAEHKRGVLVVSGPTGVGKSRFLTEVGRSATLQGFLLFHVQGRAALRSRLYGALAEAQRDWPALGQSNLRPNLFLKALQNYCRERGHAGLFVVADDVADLDPATLKALHDMLFTSDLPALALACATERDAYSRFSRLEAPLQVTVRLEPFSPQAVHVWLRGLLKWEPPSELVNWLYAQTKGLPAYLEKALHALVDLDMLRRTDDGWTLNPGYTEAGLRDDGGWSAKPPGNNLPMPPTEFVGRENEIQRLKDLLEVERMLTVVGPGGIGKTRLALQAAAESSHRFPHGCYFASAATAASGGELAVAIAEALGLQFGEPEPPETLLLNHLRDRQLLLVLDSCERLAGAVGLLNNILTNAPAVSLLATSTQRLNVPGETVFEVRGLPFPQEAAGETLESLEQIASVQLFLQSARRSVPAFELEEGNAEAIRRICQLTEGMPLGIELAAAWMRTLSPHEIAAALERSLDLLSRTGPLPVLPTSHRSVRAMLDYFWSLLADSEREMACRLSVFRGGFQREAAAAIAGASPFFLTALVDRAFLSQAAGGRYIMHELLRQYAEEKLAQMPDAQEETGDQHCDYFTEFLQARLGDLKSARQRIALDEIDTEIENVRAAWAWATGRKRLDCLTECSRPLALFFDVRGRYQEGEAAFEQAANVLRAAGPPEADQTGLGMLLARQGMCRYNLGLNEEAGDLLQQSLALLRPASEQAEIAYALYYLATALWGQGQYAEAGRAAAECLTVAQATGDAWVIGRAHMARGVVADALGEYPEAARQYRQSLSLFRQIGETRYTALTLYNLGDTMRLMGQPLEAQPLFKESLAMARKIGYRTVEGYAVNNLGQSALALRAAHEAGRHFRESMAVAQEVGDRHLLGINLSLLGEVAFALDDFDAAKEFFCQALLLAPGERAAPVATKALAGLAALLARQGRLERAVEVWARVASHPAADRADQLRWEGELEAAQAALPEADFAAAQARGRQRTLAELAAEFTAQAETLGAPAPVEIESQ